MFESRRPNGAFTLSFKKDLLISYAHLDNKPLLEGKPGWVSRLYYLLEIRVGELLGEKPEIWFDSELRGNEDFAHTLVVEQLPNVAALVTVLSPSYVRSEWCTREREAFCHASERTGGVRVGNRARIFKVIKTPIPLESHPDELQPFLGYEFYTLDPKTRQPRELSQVYGPELDQQFFLKLDDLAYDITRLLESLKRGGATASEETRDPKKTVYLAETSFDLQTEREAVWRDLVRNGYRVLPDRPLPLLAPDLASFLREQLAQCALSVHLIGDGDGVVPEGETRSIVEIQHALAAERGASGELARLLWLPPGLQTGDPRQSGFLEHLRTSPSVHEGAELLEIPFEDLKSRIHTRLGTPAKQEAEPAPQDMGGDLTRIYLICDHQDLVATRPLESFLFDQGFEVKLPLFHEDVTQARLEHEELLCACDAALIYYGEADEPWQRRKLRELQKSAGQGRERPLLVRGIYVAPPSTPQKERLRTLEALVLREPAEGFSPAALDPFLAALRRAKGGVP